MIGVACGAICVVYLLIFYDRKIVAAVGVLGLFGVMSLMFAIAGGINWACNRALSIMETLHKREKDALRGADAEENVGVLLESFCGTRHLLMHDIKSDYGNIDHVILTQAGNIFLIETKGHGGEATLEGQILLVNGKPAEKDFIKQTLNNTYWLRAELKRITGEDVWVNSIIVFANAFVPKPYRSKGIGIINKRFLIETLNNLDRKAKAPKVSSRMEEIKASLQGLAVPFPTMPTAAFYLYLNEKVQGPFSSEQIKALLQVNAATPRTPCCFFGAKEWQTIEILIS